MARIEAFDDYMTKNSDDYPQLRANLKAELLRELEIMRTTAQRGLAEHRWLPVIEDALSELRRAGSGNSDRAIDVAADKYRSVCASARSEGVVVPSAATDAYQQFVPRVEEAKLRLSKAEIGRGPSMSF